MRRGFRFTFTAALALAAAASLGPARAAEKMVPPAGAPNAAWDSLKTLVGDWDGVYEGKVAMRATYRLVSNGTALMETLNSPDHASEMVTMYHPDGRRIAMTHYCSDNNQPRMRADATEAKRIAFRYVDATNLSSPDAAHMSGLVVTLKDPDHFTQEWTHTGEGHAMTSTFVYTRKK